MKVVVVVQLGLITAAFLSGIAAVTVRIRGYNATGELDLRSNPFTLGTRVLLTCDVTGLHESSEVVNYKWYHNCQVRPNSRCEIQDGDPNYRVVKDTLLVDVTSLNQGGWYYCTADLNAAITRELAVADNPAPFLYTPTSLLPEHSVLTDVQQATGRNGQQWLTCRSGGQGTRPEIWMGSELVANSSTAISATILLGSKNPNGLYHCLSGQSQKEYFSLYLSSTVTLPTPTVSARATSMWTLTSPDGSRVERYIVEFECRVRNITFVENYMSVSANGGTGQVATNVSCFGGLGQLYRVKVWAVSGPNISRALVCAPDGQCREEEGGSQILTTQLTITSTSTLADNTETDGGGSTPPPPPTTTTTAATTTAAASAATTTTATIAATTTTETTAPTTTKSTTTAVTTTTAMTAATKTTTATPAATLTTATTTATTTSPSATATTAAATTTATIAATTTLAATTTATTSATIAATTTMTTTGVTTTTATTTAPPVTTTTTTAKTRTATTTIATTAATTTKATTTSTTTTSIPTSDRPSSSPSANAPSSGPQHDWTFIGVGAGVGMFLLLLVLSLVVVLIMVLAVVRRRAAHKQKSDPKMGGNRDPNSIEMQEKETGADTHHKDARNYKNVVEKTSGELEDRVNDSYYSYVLADMYDTIQNVSTPSVEEPSDNVTDGVHVYANAVTDTGHYAIPSRMGNMTETGNGGNRSGDVEKKGCYYNVVDLSNEELANQ